MSYKSRRPHHTPLRQSAAALATPPSRRSIIADMEEIYSLSLAAGKFSVALRAKELIGKEFGLFRPDSKRIKFSFQDLNEDEIKEALDMVLRLETEHRHEQASIEEENARIQERIDSQKDLYAEKRLQRERENQEFEEKHRKYYGPQGKPPLSPEANK